jgi:hypothetical protein
MLQCVGLPLGATRSALGLRVVSFLFGTSGLLLCSKCRNLLLKFGLHLGQLCGECNDLIFLANLTFLSAVLKHVVVRLNNPARDVRRCPTIRVATKIPIAKNVHFSFETLYFDSQ